MTADECVKMRTAFLSENRFIRNTLLDRLGIECEGPLSVRRDYHAPTEMGHRGPVFNRDFTLYFDERKPLTNYQSYCARVLPNTMGAEIFVTIDKTTHAPLFARLLSGAAFPLRYFQRYVNEVEKELSRLGAEVSIRGCIECRMFVIASEICFLCYLADEARPLDVTPQLFRNDSEACIAVYHKNQHLVCVDGWLKTTTPQSDRLSDCGARGLKLTAVLKC